jgi:bifunctional non-homologous end joining protein LigD
LNTARGARRGRLRVDSMLPPIEPLRPTLAKTVPRGREWLYELKLDGFRGMLYVEKGWGRFYSKTRRPMSRFRHLATALARALPVRDAIFDGEIIVLSETGPDFAALMRNRATPSYAAFDLLWHDGRDLRALPLWRRKKALHKLIAPSPIGYVDHTADPRLFDSVVNMDLEGIVAKRRSDPYAPSTQWLKIKHGGYSQNIERWRWFERTLH